MRVVYVKDYVTLPCEDAAEGIGKAIAEAKRTDADVLQFEEGIYPLKTFFSHDTDQTAHDAEAEYSATKDVHILLYGLKNIVISGKCDENNNPLTVLEGVNDLKLHSIMPSVLWVDSGENITVQNLKFKRNPEFASSGQIVKVDKDTVIVEVFEGNPCYDNMGTYCMNRFTTTGELSGESLSYGGGLENNFRLIGERTLALSDVGVASKVKKGDIVTFHQGAKTDFQCFFGNVNNLILKNLHTANSNGFAHLAFNIHDLTMENVKFKPEGNQYFTAPRDAFKLHKCSGSIRVNEMYIEGVRMDGQNMHSNYLFPVEIVSENIVKFFTRYSYLPLVDGSNMEFYSDQDVKVVGIKSWICEGSAEKDGFYGHIYTVIFDGVLPSWLRNDTLCLAQCWEPDLYECKNSRFVNIAGAGHLSRIDHMRISNCSYKNLMNSGILLGAEFPNHTEGGHATDIHITDCVFDNCGETARYGAYGCIGIKSDGLPGKNNRDIHIERCVFRNSKTGIDIHDADDVYIRNCVFDNIDKEICTDDSCGRISVECQTCKNI